jgi:hypothetical protein
MNNTIKDVRFFQGGRATFTVGNNSGDHCTYRISHSKDTQPLFVSLLTGSDNENSYTYLGILSTPTNTLDIRNKTVIPIGNGYDLLLTQKSPYTVDSKPVKVLAWSIKKVMNGTSLPDGYTIQHVGRCCRCGRTLTTPESVELGIGPECIKKGW